MVPVDILPSEAAQNSLREFSWLLPVSAATNTVALSTKKNGREGDFIGHRSEV